MQREDNLKQIISREIEGSVAAKRRRTLWSLLKVSYLANIKCDVVKILLRELVPDGTKYRKAHGLRRRQYLSVAPNFCLLADGYDKLKLYGLPVHGYVDGFSRKILWLKVSRSNNNAIVPAYFYIETVKKMGFCLQYLRTDCGTENGMLICTK